MGSERPEEITISRKMAKKSAMGRSVPKRWAQVDFSGGQRSFLLGCRDVPQYKVMKYLVFGVISSSLLPHMTTRIRMRMQIIPDRAF